MKLGIRHRENALAAGLAMAVGLFGCASNPSTSEGQSSDGRAALGAVAAGVPAAVAGGAVGAVGGGLYAAALCAITMGPFGLVCAPVGAVVGGVAGAVGFGAKAGRWGADAARGSPSSKPPEPPAPAPPGASPAERYFASVEPDPNAGGTQRYFASPTPNPFAPSDEPAHPPSYRYVGQFASRGDLPEHRFGDMFLDTSATGDVEAQGRRRRHAQYVVNYWSPESRSFRSYVAHAEMDCAVPRLHVRRWDAYGSADASGGVLEVHVPDPPIVIGTHQGEPDATVANAVAAACGSAPQATMLAAAASTEGAAAMPAHQSDPRPGPLVPPVAPSPQVVAAVPPSAASETARGGLPAPDTRWEYRFSDKHYGRYSAKFTVQAKLAGGIVEEMITGAGIQPVQRQVFPNDARILSHVLRHNAELIEFSPYYQVAEGEDAPASDQHVSGYPVGLLGPWLVRVVHRRWEEVSVPAGSFRALRVDVSGRRQRPTYLPGQSSEFELSVWYAPAVRRFVRLEHRSWGASAGGRGQPNGHDVVELLAYEPPSR